MSTEKSIYAVKFEGDIIDAILSRLRSHEQNYGRAPLAVLLGPDEYLALRLSAEKMASYRYGFREGELSTVFGLNIRLKTNPGIDFEVDHCELNKLLRERAKPKEEQYEHER